MTNRRRATRFILPQAGSASLRLMQDVLIERMTGETLEVLSETPLRSDEIVIVELPSGHGSRAAVRARMATSALVTIGGSQRHRLGLLVSPAASLGCDLGAVRRHLPAIGVIVRRVAVHVRDVSTSGCLLESHEPLPDGHVGLLDLKEAEDLHTEAIRICRAAQMPGSPRPWRAGAHFLALAAPSSASVRNVVARFEILDELAVPRRAAVTGQQPRTDVPGIAN